MKVAGIILLMIGLPIIWLFPVMTAPRESFGKDHPREEYLQIQLKEHQQRHILNLRVCIPAGILVGVGATLFIAGFINGRKEEQKTQPSSACDSKPAVLNA